MIMIDLKSPVKFLSIATMPYLRLHITQ